MKIPQLSTSRLHCPGCGKFLGTEIFLLLWTGSATMGESTEIKCKRCDLVFSAILKIEDSAKGSPK